MTLDEKALQTNRRTDGQTDNAVSRVAFATEKGKGNGKRRWRNWKI